MANLRLTSSPHRLSRRHVLGGTLFIGLGAILTATGCSSSSGAPTQPPAANPTSAPANPTSAPAPTQAAAAAPTSAPTTAAAAAPATGATPASATTTTNPASTASTPAAASETKWVAGTTPSTIADQFHIISWEGQGKIEKWNLAINAFFPKYYPNLKLQYDWGVPWAEYWTKLQTTLASGAALDYCWMHDTRCPTFASLGLLKSLDDDLKSLVPLGWPSEYYPTQVKAFQFKGQQYALPYDWAPGAFYVNQDLLDAAGVSLPTEDWTFDDLLQNAQKLSKHTGDPKTSQWGVNLPTDSTNMFWIVENFGGEMVIGDPPASHFNDPKTIQAFQYLDDLIWKYNVMPSPTETQALGGGATQVFVSGKLGMIYGLNDGANSLANAVNGKFKLTVAPTPKGSAGKRVQFVGGSSFAVPVKSPHPDIAYELARWIISNPDLLPKIASDPSGGTFVSRQTYWKDGLPPAQTHIPGDAYAHAFHDLGLKDGVEPNYWVGWLQWDPDVYVKNTSLLWAGQTKDVAKVLNDVHNQTVDLLKNQKQ